MPSDRTPLAELRANFIAAAAVSVRWRPWRFVIGSQ
jgi:hypothetical protein